MGYRPSVSPSLRATLDACQAVCRRPAGRPPSSQRPDEVLESARRSLDAFLQAHQRASLDHVLAVDAPELGVVAKQKASSAPCCIRWISESPDFDDLPASRVVGTA